MRRLSPSSEDISPFIRLGVAAALISQRLKADADVMAQAAVEGRHERADVPRPGAASR